MRPAIRFAALSCTLLGVCACAHSAPPLPSLDLADASAAPAAPPAAEPSHHFPNPFFRRASLATGEAKPLSSHSAIATICANAQAKAVLDRDLPGLTTRPEFDMFKHMSLRTLERMSRGQMSAEDVAKVDADLAKLPPQQAAAEPLPKMAMSQ